MSDEGCCGDRQGEGEDMIRFVDVRQANIAAGRFAWFNTVPDRFEMHNDAVVWDTWADFEKAYTGEQRDRYYSLVPEWAKGAK